MSDSVDYRNLASAVIHKAIKDLELSVYCPDRKSADVFFASGDFEGWACMAGISPSTVRQWYRERTAA